MNQSKLEVITCTWRQARENARERVTSDFGFTSDWTKNLSQSGAKPIAFWHLNENRATSTVSYNKSNYFSGRYLLSAVIFRVSLALVCFDKIVEI